MAMPTPEQVLEAVKEGPKTSRELIDRFIGSGDDRTEVRARVDTICLRLKRRGQLQRMAMPGQEKNPMWIEVKEETDGEDEDT